MELEIRVSTTQRHAYSIYKLVACIHARNFGRRKQVQFIASTIGVYFTASSFYLTFVWLANMFDYWSFITMSDFVYISGIRSHSKADPESSNMVQSFVPFMLSLHRMYAWWYMMCIWSALRALVDILKIENRERKIERTIGVRRGERGGHCRS